MGTVGLSFGSPTSGTGFDVSATVSQIVANLENVETPWKSQLTSLESQDTVLSNLGTLLSNLSNDVSQLTDFTGIMAQKTGSSSDTNALELTNATSSAVAGTHTVTVNSLATTSSGYLAEVSSSSSTLSGSITLQLGSGQAQTFTIGAEPGTPAKNTVYTGSGSSANTLAALASAINNSGIGITANVESDSTGTWLSLTSGTSGAAGNITVSSDKLTATGQVLAYTGSDGTDASGSTAATYSSGTLPSVGSADALSGTISIQVGNGTLISVATNAVQTAENGTTVNDLATYLQQNYASQVSAQVVTNSDGSVSLSLNSKTAGSAGTLTVNSTLTDSKSTTLGYTSAVTGVDANLTIDGKQNILSSSNTVSNLIPGLTFQLLSASSEPVQVIIGNDNSGVESVVNQMVSDYNSLISAANTQEGKDSSGNAEPLFGSPTLSLLEQQLMSSLNLQNPNGYLTPFVVNSSTALTGQVTVQAGNGVSKTFMTGAGTSSGNTIYTGSSTMQSLVDAINAADASTPVTYTSTAADSGTLTTADSSANLSGTIKLQTGNSTVQTIYLGTSTDAPAGDLATGNSTNSLSDLATYINDNSTTLGVSASIVDNGDGTSTLSLSTTDNSSLTVTSNIAIPGLGVSAGLTTSNGQSTLTLKSQTAGASGALTVQSALTATGDTSLNFTAKQAYSGSDATGALDTIPSANDVLSGSITIQAGAGTAQTITLDSSDDTLAELADAINNTAGIGVTATVTTNSDGSAYLSLESQTSGSAGNLTVTSNILDTTNVTSTTLNYTNSSDVSTLANLGITVSQKDDGSLTFDASVLDSALNTDYSGVLGFFQNVNSWGQSFSTMLENAGTNSPTGIIALAQKSNSSTESTLNAEVTKEESLISAEQKSLTAELISANEIMQGLPSQLQGVNELYAAITGYNQNTNG